LKAKEKMETGIATTPFGRRTMALAPNNPEVAKTLGRVE
jgi:hypothetical protein